MGGEIVDGGVELGAEVGVPGNGNGNGSGNANGNGSGNGSSNGSGTPGTAGPGASPEWQPGINRDDYTVTGPVTLSDLVNFRPAPGVDNMEPDGWMIVGLDTNFYATAGVQVQNGVLLGEQAAVRFTPVRYHWTYGDGTGASRSMPGTTWRSQGVGEFDPTPTSHVYTASGTYYIDLTIDFAAEYRWAGGSWTTIAGTIPVPANRLVATAGGAKTVLVEHECTLNPTGPGC
ncbi:MAG: hypothetical protein WED09_00870 [Homoserinimonas sp.]